MWYNLNFFIMILLSCLHCVMLDTEISNNGAKSKVLSRRKRYVAFPEGSSFSTAGCMTVGVIGQPAPSTSPGTFTFGMNWAIAYELPNATETAGYYHKYNRQIFKQQQSMQQRKHRRDLYGKLESIMDNMGYNGRSCILKTLCETSQRLLPRGENMIEEMFRTLFTLPPTKILASEPLEHTIYDAAHRLGRVLDGCDQFQCPISLVDLMKGYYNAPAPTADTARSPWSLFSSSFQ